MPHDNLGWSFSSASIPRPSAGVGQLRVLAGEFAVPAGQEAAPRKVRGADRWRRRGGFGLAPWGV